MTDEQTRAVKYFPLSELITRLHPQNPKSHDIGKIISSYQDSGYVELGTIDDRTGLFLAGHGRTIALDMMKKQGMQPPDYIRNGGADWHVPVITGYSSKNDIQAKAYLVASNQLTIVGGWDEIILAELLQEVENSTELAIEATGFDADDLDELLRDLGQVGSEWGDAFDRLPDEDRQPYQQITFTVHDSQFEIIKRAITKAKGLGPFETENENSNGNALDRICTVFLGAADG